MRYHPTTISERHVKSCPSIKGLVGGPACGACDLKPCHSSFRRLLLKAILVKVCSGTRTENLTHQCGCFVQSYLCLFIRQTKVAKLKVVVFGEDNSWQKKCWLEREQEQKQDTFFLLPTVCQLLFCCSNKHGVYQIFFVI